MHARTHVCAHALRHTSSHMSARTHAYTHIYTHIHTRTHTHTHTHSITQTHTSLWLKEEVYCTMSVWICNWWIMLRMYDVKKCEWVSECKLLWKDACYLNKRPTMKKEKKGTAMFCHAFSLLLTSMDRRLITCSYTILHDIGCKVIFSFPMISRKQVIKSQGKIWSSFYGSRFQCCLQPVTAQVVWASGWQPHLHMVGFPVVRMENEEVEGER